MAFHVPEEYRLTKIKDPRYQSTKADGNNGAFIIPFESFTIFIIASDGLGWEHVSVSLKHRCPNWREMCFLKGLFWDPEDCVIQYHPPESVYIDDHPYCLHLWRPTDQQFPIPDSFLIGRKNKDVRHSD